MIKFLADENFNNQIVRGILRQNQDIEIVRVQDVGLKGANDPDVLSWAAQEGRIVLTHDVATMITFAYERIDAGLAILHPLDCWAIASSESGFRLSRAPL